MALDDDNYVLDADGNRVLIGLTLDETREYERLDALISALIRHRSSRLTIAAHGTKGVGLCFLKNISQR
jgi:hypothetical protein